MHEVWEHAQLKARNRWTEVDSPAGRIRALLPPALPSVVTPRMDAVPALGQHTDAILRELDFDVATIARLRVDGAI
jgi:itaconate CoA-transferase